MKRSFSASELTPTDNYKLLTGLVVPRPIGWVGSISEDGIPNVAPFSFFNVVCPSPPMVMFSTVRPGGRHKDTRTNVAAMGEFTVNIVTAEVAEAMNLTSANLPPDGNEFQHSGLTPVPATMIAAPMVGEAKASFECVLRQIVDLGDDVMGSTLIIGEVIAFHIDEELLDGTRVDQKALRAVGRMGGPTYTNTSDLFDMIRPD